MSSLSRGSRIILVALAALIAGGIAGSWATVKAGHSLFEKGSGATMWLAGTSGNGNLNGQISFENGFVPVVQKVQPAVVNIASSKVIRAPENVAPNLEDPFFQQFFGQDFLRELRTPKERREHSLGSGAVVSANGYILTNYHVVNGASEIKATLSDNRELTATVVGTDSKSDLAVLKIDAKDLPVVIFGDSSKVRVGEFVVAVGNPFGVGQTVTMGIVSATSRGGLGIEDYEDFIQTDAAINPGNSGGPLVNASGNLIGINTAIISGSGGNQGVGFSVPVNMARHVMDQIVKSGKVTRGWIGISIQPVDAAIAKSFGLTGQARGALISEVVPDSPAARAGLMSGDIVLQLNNEPIADSRALSLRISDLSPGTNVSLQIWRNGKQSQANVTLGEQPAQTAAREKEQPGPNRSELGISVEPLTPQIASRLGLTQSTKGVVIDSVEPGSAAEEAGLQGGDVIREINHKPVSGTDDFESAVRQAKDSSILLWIDRGGQDHYVVVETHKAA